MKKLLFVLLSLMFIACSKEQNYIKPEGMDKNGFYVYTDSCLKKEVNNSSKPNKCIMSVKVKTHIDIKFIDPLIIKDLYEWKMCLNNSDYSDLSCENCDRIYNKLGIFINY